MMGLVGAFSFLVLALAVIFLVAGCAQQAQQAQKVEVESPQRDALQEGERPARTWSG